MRNEIVSLRWVASFSLIVVLGLADVGGAEIRSQASGVTIIGRSQGIEDDFSLAIERNSVAKGRVSLIDITELTLSGSFAWNSNQFTPGSAPSVGAAPETYYLRFESGALEGRFYRILGNGAKSLSLDVPPTESLTTVAAGDRVKIVPYWTLAKLFSPAGEAPIGIVPTTVFADPQTKIAVAKRFTTGTSAEIEKEWLYASSAANGIAGWYQVGNTGAGRADNLPLEPDRYYVITTPAGSTQLTGLSGWVVTHALSLPQTTSTNGTVQQFLGLEVPVPVAIDETGMGGSAGFQSSSAVNAPKDVLYISDTDANGFDLGLFHLASATNPGWYLVSNSAAGLQGATRTIGDSRGLILSKAPAVSSGRLVIRARPWNSLSASALQLSTSLPSVTLVQGGVAQVVRVTRGGTYVGNAALTLGVLPAKISANLGSTSLAAIGSNATVTMQAATDAPLGTSTIELTLTATDFSALVAKAKFTAIVVTSLPPAPPVVIGASTIRTNKSKITIKGTAKADPGVSVEYRVGNLPYAKAAGVRNWTINILPKLGKNVVQIRSVNSLNGKASTARTIIINRVRK